ncbi:WD40-repeat-containing domain protein [Fimicolochytrium jonesii]|uniref:WD40-repeat-containing domain protein n=1 Tax=Fimicolochytrium jonesii TaxID=1396493 RepID=UPI0022FE9874|nr:WD40-repeat-containing domain protein [Fimicolochytrium jonesii]KAI8823647.1 WD40-repeat-containing domain protein [Fimicolochytrium jonesii]
MEIPPEFSGVAALGDIPYIISTFDTLPPQLKSYLLLQLLRRCQFPTLQFVSSLILPSLKRDYVALLPVELAYHILQYLDLRSLGRCAAVSRAWKRVVDGEGAELAVWKKRLQCEGWYDDMEGVQTPPNLFKNLYRRHHVIRQNWFHGRYKHISFPGHAFNVVTCLQFDADKIVSGSDDQTIHIYDTRTGGLKKRLEGHEGGVWALQYWNEVLVSGSTDRSVRVWDMEEGACTHLFEGHTSTVRCLIIIIPHKNPATGKMEPEVPLIVTGSRDATLRVWKLPHPKRDIPWLPGCGASSPSTGSTRASNPFFKYVLCGHSDSVRAIAGYGNTLVSGSYDCTVRVWDLGTGAVSFICRGHRQKVYSVGYSHELRRAVSGSMDATVRIWCTRTGAQLFNLEGHTSLVGLLELSPQYLVSAAADATLRIWSPTTGQCLANLTGHSAAITCFHHEPRLNRIVSGSDGGVKVWELNSTGYGSGQPPAGAPFVPALAFTQGPNGPQPVHGRFIRDLVGNVQGVWRVRMDEQRLVCAVQRDGGPTWFEVLDFTEGIEAGVKLEGLGDQEDSNDGSCAGGSDEDDDGDDDDDDVEDEDYAEMGDNGSRDGDDNSFGTLSTDSNPEDVEEIELPPRPPRR